MMPSVAACHSITWALAAATEPQVRYRKEQYSANACINLSSVPSGSSGHDLRTGLTPSGDALGLEDIQLVGIITTRVHA